MRFISVVVLFAGFVLTSFGQSFKQTGIASYYADKFVGHTTANGEKYKHSKLTAAHKTLPFGTLLKVKNLENGKEVTVRVNDRGPFVKDRIIDLSKSAAEELDFINKGITNVEIVSIGNSDAQRVTYSTLDRPPDDDFELPSKYYSISVNEQKISGYGVQIGSYREMVNLVQLAEELQKAYNDRIFIQVSIIQEVKYYKIIIGHLKSREKVSKLYDKLRQDYPGSFVIKF
jgi:peptidoglycan lytic transglycosylase